MKYILIIFLFVTTLSIGQVFTLNDFALLSNKTAAVITFTDNFTRSDANPMSDPASGGTWTSGPGATGDCKIVSNELVISSGQCGCRVLTPTFSANQKATITISGTLNRQSKAAAVRIASTSDFDCYFIYLDNLTTLTIYKCTDSGTLGFAALGASFTISSVSVGDTIGISATGTSTTTLEAFLNGVSLGTRIDSSSPFTNGQPGIYHTSGGITLFEATEI